MGGLFTLLRSVLCLLLCFACRPQEKKAAPERLFCNHCHTETLHDLRKAITHVDDDEIFYANGQALPIWEETKNEMFECRGCSSVVLRRTWNFSEFDDSTVQYFPPRLARTKPKWFKDIPDEVQKILLEIYRSLDADNRALPIMGARAVIDRVISDTIGDEGTFVQKLKKLEDDRHITIKGRKILQAALEAGNAAAHRGYAPSIDQVQAVMDIVENLVQSTYVLENVANEITKSTPARPSKKVNTYSPF